jgi:hypothetical protein
MYADTAIFIYTRIVFHTGANWKAEEWLAKRLPYQLKFIRSLHLYGDLYIPDSNGGKALSCVLLGLKTLVYDCDRVNNIAKVYSRYTGTFPAVVDYSTLDYVREARKLLLEREGEGVNVVLPWNEGV